MNPLTPRSNFHVTSPYIDQQACDESRQMRWLDDFVFIKLQILLSNDKGNL